MKIKKIKLFTASIHRVANPYPLHPNKGFTLVELYARREQARKGFTLVELYARREQARKGFTLVELYARREQARKGFTLVELIIYMGLVSMLILIFMDLLSASFNAQLSSQSTTGVVQDGRYIYTRLIYDINRADSVSIPANLGDSSPSLIITINGNNFTYGTSGGNFVLTTDTAAYTLNSFGTSVSNLSFQRIGNAGGKHTIRIMYTISGKTNISGRYDTKSFETAAGLR